MCIRDSIVDDQHVRTKNLRAALAAVQDLSNDKYLYYSNSSMKCGDWIGHSGLGGQFLAINLKNGIVASYFSVIETDSGTDENYKRDMINMLDEIVNKNF